MWRQDVEPGLSRGGGSGRGSPTASDRSRASGGHRSGRSSKSNMKCIISVGLLLPALAAVIGVVAWAVSAEAVIGAKRDSIKADSSAIRSYQDQRTPLRNTATDGADGRDFDLKTSSRSVKENSGRMGLKSGTSLTNSPSSNLHSTSSEGRKHTISRTSHQTDFVSHSGGSTTSSVGNSQTAGHQVADQDGVNDFVGQLLNTPRDPNGKVRQYVIVPVPDVPASTSLNSQHLVSSLNNQNSPSRIGHSTTTTTSKSMASDNFPKKSFTAAGGPLSMGNAPGPSHFDHSGTLSQNAPPPVIKGLSENPVASATTTHRTFIQPPSSPNNGGSMPLAGNMESHHKPSMTNSLGPHRKGEQAIPPAVSETISTPDNAYQSPFSPVVGPPSRYGNAPPPNYGGGGGNRPPPPPPPPQPYPQGGGGGGGGYGGPPPVNHGGYNSFSPAGQRTLISVHPAEQYGGNADRAGNYDHGPWNADRAGGYDHYHHHPPSKPGITVHLGGSPGHGSEVVTSPLGLFKTLLLPLLPKPKVNLNGKVVFGVVLEKGVGFGGNKHPPPAAQIHAYAHHGGGGGHHY